ncbi:MAG: arylsulfotransferase (ASST) [bacterium]|nr:arylsulfotransferase (ASST) [bacterium]
MNCRDLVVVVAGLALLASACSESSVGSTTSVAESTTGAASDLNTTDAPMVDECETSAESESCAATSDEGGYMLFAPLGSTTTYLTDREGNVAHSWESEYRPGNSVYLLDDGDLLHTGSIPSDVFAAGGSGGVIQRINWDGEVEWELSFADADHHLHHDIELLPDGNILAIAWEFKSAHEAVAAGLDPDAVPSGSAQGLSFDQIMELDPTTGEVVWEWHVWDHLVQEYDASLPNYGAVTESPERVDLNYPQKPDFTHINSIDYDPESDQILLSVHSFSEIWVIDHATTTDEAAGPAGDLLYRWGNPEACGGDGERILYAQHDAEWIDDGLPGAGNILIFNNGDRQLRPSSTIEEITLPDDGITADAEIVWSHDTGVFAQNISGSQRLPSGNTLITSGPTGTLYEVTPGGETVWTYVNPFAIERPGDKTSNAVFRADWYPASFLVETPEGVTESGVEAAGSARGSYAIVDTGQVLWPDRTGP